MNRDTDYAALYFHVTHPNTKQMNGFFSCSDSGAHWNIAAIVPKRANTVGTQMGRRNGDGVEARNDGHVFQGEVFFFF